MTVPPSPSFTSYVGRGVPFRFHGVSELGPAPTTVPTPPTLTDIIPTPSPREGDLSYLTIAQAAALIREKKLSPVELTHALLARIERLNPVLNAFITVTADLALGQARQAEEEIQKGEYRGPLHGIPLALKDLVATRGVLTTGGTGAFSDWVPREDAEVWRRLRNAGAVLLGKLGMHEMAFGFSNLNPFYGPTRNPWDIARATGGSSGGSGAAVAAGLCLGSVGSDTGGSIRVPASFCGVSGFKPTFGRVSTRGTIYLSWTRDHIGPLARTAEDAAMLLNAMAGFDPHNPLSAPCADEDFTTGLSSPLAGLRIAMPASTLAPSVLSGTGSDSPGPGLDPEVLQAVRAAASVLGALGAMIEEVNLESWDDLRDTPEVRAAFRVESAFYLEELPPERRALFSDRYKDGLISGASTTAPVYLRSLQHTQKVAAALEKAMEGFDILLLPSTPTAAPSISAVVQAEQAAAEVAAAARARGGTPQPGGAFGPLATVNRYTSPMNQSGQPAMSVPCGLTQAGLPIGLMVVGRRFSDGLVLRVAHAYQQATDWHTRRPLP